MPKTLFKTFLLTAAFLGSATLRAADSDEKNVLAAVQKLFDGMAARDGSAIRGAMAPDARLTRVRGDQPPSSISVDQFVKGIEGNQGHLLERIWEPKVLVRGGLASVWAEYDFHLNGKLTHCGVDAFQLVKTGQGWQVSSIAYTVETENCPASPLGPPK